MKIIADRLQLLMKELGINQNGLAVITGVDRAVICRLLNDKTEPTIKNIIKIAEATKTSPEWILGYGTDDVRRKLP